MIQLENTFQKLVKKLTFLTLFLININHEKNYDIHVWMYEKKFKNYTALLSQVSPV